MSTWRRAYGGLAGLCCGLIILGPALRPGFLLIYDMVFVPELGLGDRTLGVDGSVPRAVPNDAMVALLSQLAPGWVVQKALLLLVFVGVGAGIGGLVRSRTGAVAGAILACWNPYVGERLAIGHWGFLLGYACLPWVANAAAACRDGRPYGRARLGGALVLVALTGSTGSVLALILVACVLLIPGRRSAWAGGVPGGTSGGASPAGAWASRARAPGARLTDVCWVAVAAILANAPWWFPFLTTAASAQADSGGVEAFMARADTPYGILPSLLTGGGIWNRGVWFDERSSAVVAGAALLGVGIAAVTWVRGRGWTWTPAGGGLALAGVAGLLTAGLSSVVGGRDLVTWIVTEVPGGGLMRDSQKFVALWVVLLAVCVGSLAEVARAAMARHDAGVIGSAFLALVVSAWPIATLPTLAQGELGKWQAVSYPADQLALADQIAKLPPGGVAVFPWTLYRRYSWNDDTVLLDPWQRLVSREVLVNDDLPLSTRTVRGESEPARQVGEALTTHGDVLGALRQNGIRYVLVLTDQPTEPGTPDLAGQQVIGSAQDARLYDLGTRGLQLTPAPSADRYLGLYAGAAALVLTAGAWVVTAVIRRRAATPARGM